MPNSRCAIKMLHRVHEISSSNETDSNSTFDFDRLWHLTHSVSNVTEFLLFNYYLILRLNNPHRQSLSYASSWSSQIAIIADSLIPFWASSIWQLQMASQHYCNTEVRFDWVLRRHAADL